MLTNFREEDQDIQPDARSRGEIPKSFLTLPALIETLPEEWVEQLLAEEDIHSVGGFSLIFGDLRPGRQGLGVLSNRTANIEDITWLAKSGGEVHGLSNALFEDQGWPKVVDGKRLLKEALEESFEKRESDEQLLARLFDVLSHDSLPERKEGQTWPAYSRELRRSILIPPIGGSSEAGVANKEGESSGANYVSEGAKSLYATQKQTVILVDHNGHVKFVERTLFDDRGRMIPPSLRDHVVEFQIVEWEK